MSAHLADRVDARGLDLVTGEASSALFGATLATLTDQHGFRLDRITPADDPSLAELSAGDLAVTIARSGHVDAPTAAPCSPEAPLAVSPDADEWVVGRAGMRYRDLIPGRLGGWCIGSNIEVCDGGPVPDLVHHHAIRFQVIVCQRGWVDVIYQDQGPAFRIEAGDLVLQPPHIRHRVLASSAGARVVELGCPAVHDTLFDYDLELPTGDLAPDRDFGGQRFVRHICADAPWVDGPALGFRTQPTDIAAATGGLANIDFIAAAGDTPAGSFAADGLDAVSFVFVMHGSATIVVDGVNHAAPEGFALTLPAGQPWQLDDASADLLVLRVRLPS